MGMKRNLIVRIKRFYRGKTRRLCTLCINHLSPNRLYKHPTLVSYLWYGSQKGYLPRLSSPRDFNEQLIAINIEAFHDKNKRELRIRCADKFAVRDYIHSLGLSKILNDCFGVYDSFEEIDFNLLPEQFVLKLTNGCGQNYICKDKSTLDLNNLKSLFDTWMSKSNVFGLKTAEWHYSVIKPRIIAERYLSILGEDTSLIDFKFHCIHGRVTGILVCYDRDPKLHEANFDFYDTEWNLTDGIFPMYHKHQRIIPKPSSFDEMKCIAETISRGIDYVRVDLYEINGKPIFGEMTFTPAGNIMTRYQQWVLDNMLKFYNETKKD